MLFRSVREFVISNSGLDLVDVYMGLGGILTGSAREEQQLAERTETVIRSHAVTRKDKEIERKKTVLESKIASLKEEFESVQDELNKTHIEEQLTREVMEQNRREILQKREGKK